MTVVGYGTLPIIPSFAGFNTSIDRHLTSAMPTAGVRAGEQFGDGMTTGVERSTSRLASLTKTAVATTTLALGAGVVAAGAWGVQLAAANEQAQISFTTMLGSAQQATTFLADLRDFAASTPFEFPELQTAASSLISAGVEAGKVIPIMTTLGDVTSGMGTGSEGIRRATVALQQMQAAGKITAEDLNQLRDAGVPVYDLLAAATGKAKDEVTELASAGKLGRTELDQLMLALESGEGLERFAGLMDKQSQSLSGLASTLKDVAGQGLATALEPVAAEMRDMLPVAIALGEDAMPKVADAISVALSTGKDFAGWASDLGSDLAEDVLPVLEDLVDIGGDAMPAALGVAKDGVEGVAGALGLLFDLVQPVTAFLADHTGVVVAVGAAYAGWKVADAIGDVSDAFDILAIKAYNATGAVASSAAAANFGAIAAGAKSMATNLMAVPDWNQRSVPGMKAGLDQMRQGVGGLTSGVNLLQASFVAAGIGVGVMFQAMDAAHAQAKQQIEDLKPPEFDDRSLASLVRYQSELSAAYMAAVENENAVSDFQAVLAGTAQLMTPLENKIVDQAVAVGDLDKAYGVAAEATDRWLIGTKGVAGALDLSQQSVERWIKKLDLDPNEIGWVATRDAIEAASTMATEGTPSVENMAEAFSTLADDTASSKEQLDAWKDLVDEIVGTEKGIFDATTDFQGGLDELTKSILENGFSLDEHTEKGRANRQALSASVDEAIAMAEAYGGTKNIEAATMVMEDARRKIIEAGEAAGMSKGEVEDWLAQLGLTPEDISTLVKVTGTDGAKQELDQVISRANALDGRVISLNVRALMDGTSNAALAALGAGASPGMINAERNRWGGIYSAAAGGLSTAKMLGPGPTLFQWREPETGGEAFVPRFGDRARSEDIVGRVAREWLGGEFIPAKELDKRPAGAGRARRGRTAGTRVRDVVINMPTADPRRVSDELMWEQG